MTTFTLYRADAKTIESQNICYSKNDDAPMTAYIVDNGRVAVIFKEVNNA